MVANATDCVIDATVADYLRIYGIWIVYPQQLDIFGFSLESLRQIMKQGFGKSGRKFGRFAAWTAGVAILASPVFVASVSAQFVSSATSQNWMDRFTPAGVDSRLAEKMKSKTQASAAIRFPFTPAGSVQRSDATITVAARANSNFNSNAVSVRSAIADIKAGNGGTLRLNNSDYRLTAVRGWQGFETPVAQAVNIEQPRLDQMVGKGSFNLNEAEKKKPSRFNTNMSVAKVGNVANPRGNAAAGDYAMNVGGSFSISRRVDVTAGVRYASERDRVIPAADNRADSEAVYVGTKIRF
jgi:hypothetical protein